MYHQAMTPNVISLLNTPSQIGTESFTTLIEGKRFKLEHIISRGDSSPDNFWYEQAQDEWVVLMSGHATLTFEQANLDLKAGDAVLIPAQLKHRVSYTSVDAVWIALRFEE